MTKIFKHHLRYTRIYGIWQHIKERCLHPKSHAWKRYGGRGISICDEWKNSVESFYNWAIENGYNENLSIDRIDNNGNYEPSNCRWVDAKIQANNRINNKIITYNNKSLTLSQWSKILNIKYNTLNKRLNLGWSIEKAFNTPIKNFRNLV